MSNTIKLLVELEFTAPIENPEHITGQVETALLNHVGNTGLVHPFEDAATKRLKVSPVKPRPVAEIINTEK